jgi:hypothetical protein
MNGESETEKKVRLIQNSSRTAFTWAEIQAMLKKANIELQDNDIITCGFVEAEDFGDSGWESHYSFSVERIVKRSDKEIEQIRKNNERNVEIARKNRLETYLKLKNEFEPNEDQSLPPFAQKIKDRLREYSKFKSEFDDEYDESAIQKEHEKFHKDNRESL